MRSYNRMVEDGDWPPTNKETSFFMLGVVIGGWIGYTIGYVLYGLL